MHKSSIYLSDDQKAALRHLAEDTGRSEADLIRAALERLVAPPHQAGPAELATKQVVFERPALYGVGVGPGDPELLTLRAVALLGAADRVFVLSTDERSVGRAEATVRAAVPRARIDRRPFSIGKPAERERSLVALSEATVAALDAGELAVLAVLGDPMQWTVFPALADHVRSLRLGAAVHAVPGVTGYQNAAAQHCVALGTAGGTLIVTDDLEHAERHVALPVAQHDTVVVQKARIDGAPLKALSQRLGRALMVLESVGQREATAPGDGPLPYLATAILPPVPTAHSERPADSAKQPPTASTRPRRKASA